MDWSYDARSLDGDWVCRECGYPYDSIEELARTELQYRNWRREYRLKARRSRAA
jgi:hypothetical protein